MNYRIFFILLFATLILLFQCDRKTDPIIEDDDDDLESELYFPPTGSDEWETSSLLELGWNENASDELYSFWSQMEPGLF